MNGSPAVSVLMPVFNAARHLPETLRSLQRQKFSDFEVLVIDDGSTDQTASIAQGLGDKRVRVISHSRNLGLVASLNEGLAEANAPIIARLDGDDLAHPDRLGRQLQFLRGNPAVPVLGSDAWLINSDGKWCGRWRTAGSADLVRWDCGFRTPFAHSSVMFRRDVIVNRFDGYRDCRVSEDMDLWGRVAAELPVVTIPDCLVSYRQHSGSIMAVAGVSDGAERIAVVRAILLRNLAALAPGTSMRELGQLAEVWSDPEPTAEWDEYFHAIAAVRLGFLRGHRTVLGLARVLADQHYMLLGRIAAADRWSFLRALCRAERMAFLRLPLARLAIMLMRG